MLTEKHRPVLIVIAGPNGSGKTTITSKILKHEWLEGALYVNPDQVAQDKFGDWNSPEAVLQAAQYCEEQREACLKNGDSQLQACGSPGRSRLCLRQLYRRHRGPLAFPHDRW